MEYTVLSTNWNAQPNAPEPEWRVSSNDLIVEFYLNHYIYPQFKEDDRGRLTFINCHKYDFRGSNDEGYFMGQHRYKHEELPWGEFYELKTEWETDFPNNPIIVSEPVNKNGLKHYLFFFRDETLECVAEDYFIEFI